MKRAALATAAVAAVVGSLVAVNAGPSPAPAAPAPATAVRFPAGFGTPIYVGNTQVWPTTTTTGGATSTSTSNPATTTATTSAPTTSSTSPTSTGTPTTTPTTTIPSTTDPSTTATSVAASTTVPTTTTTPATTTSAPSATTTTTTPNPAACGLQNAAFCATFDQPTTGPKTQTGDLDPLLWGVSRSRDINPAGILNGAVNSTNPCSSTSVPAPADVRICNGQLVESQNDGGSVTDTDSYPKQPFDFTGRTGKVVFDVSSDSDGTHAAWPEFLITDEPVPGARSEISFQPTPQAVNEIGFTLALSTGGYAGVGQTGVDTFFATVNNTYETVATTQYGTVTKGSPSALNHVEVDVSKTRIDVYMTEPGKTALKHVAGADLNLGFTQGLVWLNDVHYNAHKAIEPCECGTQFDHAFAWDNLGFDGPKTYRDWGFDVPYNTAQGGRSTYGDPEINLGYLIGTGPTQLAVTGVQLGTATKAKVVLNAYTFGGSTISVAVNGGKAVAHAIDANFAWRSFSILVPLTDVKAGTNTLTFTSNDGSTTVANVSLILVAAAPVP